MFIGFCCRIKKSASGKKKAVAMKWDCLLRLIGGNNRYHSENSWRILFSATFYLIFFVSIRPCKCYPMYVSSPLLMLLRAITIHPYIFAHLHLPFHPLTSLLLFSNKSYMRVVLSHSIVMHVTAIALIPAVMRVCVVFAEAVTAALVQKLQLVCSTFSFFLSLFFSFLVNFVAACCYCYWNWVPSSDGALAWGR